MRRIFSNIISTVVALGIAVVVVDLIAFYVLDIKPGGYKADRFFEFSPELGHVHKPSTSGTYYRYLMGERFEVSINSHGFADRERAHEKTRPRIALIGDSTTEFWEVDEPERGQFVLEERLGGRCEVLNLGVRAYGTDQTFLMYRDVGHTYDADIVIYTFCVNDPADNMRKTGKPYFEFYPGRVDSLVLRNVPVQTPKQWDKHGVVYERSFVYRLYSEARNQLMPGVRLRRLLGKDVRPRPHFELRSYKKEYSEKDSARMDLTLALISRLNDSVTGRGKRFLLVEGIYKPMAHAETREAIVDIYGDIFDPDRVSSILDEHCRHEGIEFLSLPRVAEAQGVDTSTLMHPRDNMHFDADGVKFFADAVATKLNALDWLEN